jgi:hypothetical protein
MKHPHESKFAICIANEDCDDLEVWKLYRVMPDTTAAKEDYLRIVDESGEDYLYPANRFVLVDFPPQIEDKLLAIHSSSVA